MNDNSSDRPSEPSSDRPSERPHEIDRLDLALVDASTEMLEGLSAARHPLSVVSKSLSALGSALGVERAVVAIDDAIYGRQVFCSQREPIGVGGAGLWGPPGLITEPARSLDDRLVRLVVAAVGTAFERARSAEPDVDTSLDLVARLEAATDSSARYGWGFTLVLLSVDQPDDDARERVAVHLRASDTVVEMGVRELGILLPAAAGDEIPQILARVARGGAIPTICYGLAACPGDATTPSALLLLAKERLREADKARRLPAIRTPGAPRV